MLWSHVPLQLSCAASAMFLSKCAWVQHVCVNVPFLWITKRPLNYTGGSSKSNPPKENPPSARDKYRLEDCKFVCTAEYQLEPLKGKDGKAPIWTYFFHRFKQFVSHLPPSSVCRESCMGHQVFCLVNVASRNRMWNDHSQQRILHLTIAEKFKWWDASSTYHNSSTKGLLFLKFWSLSTPVFWGQMRSFGCRQELNMRMPGIEICKQICGWRQLRLICFSSCECCKEASACLHSDPWGTQMFDGSQPIANLSSILYIHIYIYKYRYRYSSLCG